MIANGLTIFIGMGLETLWGNRLGFFIIGAFAYYSYNRLRSMNDKVPKDMIKQENNL
jgi:hypothetical protein